MAKRQLIINCDDFGQSRAANAAIIHLLEERKVSSATVMPPAPAFEEVAAWCRKRNATNVGLHLTFTSEYDAIRWRSLTGDPSLHDESGYMYHTVEEFEKGASPAAVKRELQAQFEAVIKAGIRIPHADNHMGSLYGMSSGRSYLPQVFLQCSRRRLPFRLFRRFWLKDAFMAEIASHPGSQRALDMAVALADVLGVGLPDYLISHPYHVEEGETYESFRRSILAKLYELPEDGVSETYFHPAVEDEELSRRIPSWEKRVWEYRLLQEEDFAYTLRDAGVELTDYGYVQAYRRRPRLPAAIRLAKALLFRG